jgi:hypothetical protein
VTAVLRRLTLCLAFAGALTACGASTAASAPPPLTGTNAVNIDGAIVSRGGLHTSCAGDGRSQYSMLGQWDDSPESYAFQILVSPYKGPGTYLPKNQTPNFPYSQMTLTRLDTARQVFQLAGNEGTVTVDPGQKTGRFDGKFATTDGGQFRVYGNWSCETVS